jgi:hypothetical protein
MLIGMRAMLATIPAAKQAGSEAYTVAEGGEATAPAAEVHERAVQHLHPAAASGAWLLKSRLAVCQRHDARELRSDRINASAAKRRGLSHRPRLIETSLRRPVSPGVSRVVSLKNKARQCFKAYCLGHCLAGVSLAAQVSRCLKP